MRKFRQGDKVYIDGITRKNLETINGYYTIYDMSCYDGYRYNLYFMTKPLFGISYTNSQFHKIKTMEEMRFMKLEKIMKLIKSKQNEI